MTVPEVWSNGTIRRLTGAPKTLPYYPRAFLTSKGTVFVSGSVVFTRYLTTTGAGCLEERPEAPLCQSRDYGSAVMYEQGKVLYAGGSRTTNTAEVIDLDAAAPAWKWTGSMSVPRRHLNLTVLPTGEVLATGGVAGTKFNDPTKAVYTTELWSPATGQWTTLSSNAVMRGYHGTVAADAGWAGARRRRQRSRGNTQSAERGDLLAAVPVPRPPAHHRERARDPPVRATFRVSTADAGSITKVSLIRLGAVDPRVRPEHQAAAAHVLDGRQRC